MSFPVQDIFSEPLEEKKNHLFVYHVHGFRQYMGTIKWHYSPNCSVLETWKPGKNLGKTIMRDYRTYREFLDSACGVCKRKYKKEFLAMELDDAFENMHRVIPPIMERNLENKTFH